MSIGPVLFYVLLGSAFCAVVAFIADAAIERYWRSR